MRSAWQRTHTCGELRLEHVGQTVTLNGWVNTDRDHGGLVFIDLRDRYGITQVVFHPEEGSKFHEEARTLRSEFVVSVTGKVEARPPAMRNPKRKTGDIEVRVTELTILNKSETPPFELTEGTELASEELRLKYRYLDLRRQKMQDIIILRHELCRTIREMLSAEGFLEVETPLLGRSTPEGARDYLVPSRVHEGLWYALPQSPQLYKQILMISGYDKYFQIARCLRDEDLRANRQPEFTQLDLEMTFVEVNDVMNVIERLTQKVFERCINYKVQIPFRRIPYSESMLKYGNDKPDLRFGLEITDVTDIPVMAAIKVLEGAIKSGGKVRGINAKGKAEQYSNAKLNGPEFQDVVKNLGAKGLLYMKVEADGLKSSVMKFLSPEQQKELETALRERMNAEVGDLLFFVADNEETVCAALAGFRLHLGKLFGLIDKSKYEFAWIVDFPMFMWDKEENRWAANHHPFTSPKTEHLEKLVSDPGHAEAKAYDLVINGDECGGGSIRIHSPEVQQQVFGLLGMSEEEAKGRFGFLLDALKFGAPPHGGIALGIDRWVMMLAETDNIRDCIAFPKTQRATDLMTGAPGAVDKRQLKELGLVK